MNCAVTEKPTEVLVAIKEIADESAEQVIYIQSDRTITYRPGVDLGLITITSSSMSDPKDVIMAAGKDTVVLLDMRSGYFYSCVRSD